jgi:hypothetical protein
MLGRHRSSLRRRSRQPAQKGSLMITVEEIESACDASQSLDYCRHSVEAPELTHEEMFYPFGFPMLARTNAPEILTHLREIWGVFDKRFDTEAVRIDVHVVESESTECPPAPTYRLMMPLMMAVADANNYFVADLAGNLTQATISRAAVKHTLYLRYFFLESMGFQHIASRFTTPVHGACVVRNGRGVLLMGDSGVGKSTLSYACARAGWTFVSDDASFLLNGGSKRMIIGDCHKVRFRTSAVELSRGVGADTSFSGQTVDRDADEISAAHDLRRYGAS